MAATIKLNFNKATWILLGLNIVGSLLWLFGFHQIRLFLLSSSGVLILSLFYFKKTPRVADFLKFLIVIMFLVSLRHTHQVGYFVNLIIDLSAFGLMLSVFLIREVSTKKLFRYLRGFIIVSLIYFICTIPFLNLALIGAGASNIRNDVFLSLQDADINNASGAATWLIIYNTQQLLSTFFILFLLIVPLVGVEFKKFYFYILLVGIFVSLIIYSSFYQKRQTIVELLLVCFLTFYYNRDELPTVFPKSKFFNFLFITIFIFLILTSSALSNVIERFTETAENLSEFGRLEEATQVLSEFTIGEWLLGKGFAYRAPDTPGGNILHIGYANLLMKGGFALLLFYIFNSIENLRYCLSRVKFYPEYKVGVSFSIFSMIALSYSPGYHWFITTIVMGLSMFSRYFINDFVNDKYHNTRS